MVSIIILGVVNTSLSGSGSRSIDTMRTFLLTGIFALWASMFLVNDPRRRQMFDWFCAGALGVIILVEMIFSGWSGETLARGFSRSLSSIRSPWEL